MATKIEKIEVFLVVTLLVVHGLWYNLIGHLSSLRGIDLSPFVKTPLDEIIPYIPYFVIPYLLTWIYPLLILGFLLTVKGFNVGVFRRIYVSFLVMMVVCYCLWLLFPSEVHIRMNQMALSQGNFWSHLVLFTYQNATTWNPIPSFHICVTWFSYRVIRFYVKKFAWIFLVVFIMISLSTLFIRIHYILDVIGGWLIAEIIYYFFRKMENKNTFGMLSSKFVITAYCTIFFVSVIGYTMLLVFI